MRLQNHGGEETRKEKRKMSNNRGGKRQANSPVGASFKDPRCEARGNQQSNRFDAFGDYESESDGGDWTQVTNGRNNIQSNNDEHQQQQQQTTQNIATTFAQVAAQGPGAAQAQAQASGQIPPGGKKTLERMFRTAPPDGPNRDNIIIEIRQVNGVPFKGSLHYKEAKYGIFNGCLGLDPTLVHGLSFAFSDYPIIKYKLRQQIDIDSLRNREFFEFARKYTVNGMEKNDVLACKIKGIRSDYSNDPTSGDSDPDVRWVKIEWCDYAFEEHEILAWLEQFGQPIGHVTEEIYPDSDSDGDPTGNGTFTVKMKLHTPIPQLLPMWGKRIRIYYRGIQKLCSRCFGNHPRKNCRSAKRRWVDYVLDFMGHYTEIPNELYGRWFEVVNNEFGEIIENSTSNTQGEEQREAVQPDQTAGGQPHNNSNLRQDGPPPQNRPIQLKPAFVSRARPSNQQTGSRSEENNRNQSQSRLSYHRQEPRQDNRLTREEEDNLSDYLALGMSISQAKEAFKKEVEMAELRARVRENRRNVTRGDVNSTNRTQIGNMSTNRGRGRGGLSFN